MFLLDFPASLPDPEEAGRGLDGPSRPAEVIPRSLDVVLRGGRQRSSSAFSCRHCGLLALSQRRMKAGGAG